MHAWRRLYLTVCLVFLIGFPVTIHAQTPRQTVSVDFKPQQKIIVPSNLTSFEPFTITSNQDFATLGFPGNGSEENPFMINGYNITGDGEQDLISITDTNAHFVISNNWLSGGDVAIYLDGVSNGVIDSNIITKNDQDGIFLIRTSHHNTISNNSIIDNGNSGIFSSSSSQINTINNNVIAHNQWDGIGLSTSPLYSIYNNSIANNGYRGIHLDSTGDTTITNNTIMNNTDYAIRISRSSDNNVVEYNDFIDNNNCNPQVRDNGVANTVQDNFWNDWTEPDTNDDGIVDEQYPIPGNSDNNDPNPRVSPVTIPSVPTSAHCPQRTLPTEDEETPILPIYLVIPLLITLSVINKRYKQSE